MTVPGALPPMPPVDPYDGTPVSERVPVPCEPPPGETKIDLPRLMNLPSTAEVRALCTDRAALEQLLRDGWRLIDAYLSPRPEGANQEWMKSNVERRQECLAASNWLWLHGICLVLVLDQLACGGTVTGFPVQGVSLELSERAPATEPKEVRL